MDTINLNFHIVGPTWAWLVLAFAIAMHAIAYAIKTGVEIAKYFIERKLTF